MEKTKEIYKCDECGKSGKWEEEIGLCSGCENVYCLNGGCNWLREEDNFSVCEACYPEQCRAKFIIESSLERVKLEPMEKYIYTGQNINDAVSVLEKEGYTPKYRLDNDGKRIIKYPKGCGIYLLFGDEYRVKGIGIWDGLHRTDNNIGLFATEEDVVAAYGDGFTVEKISGYISYYHYSEHNLKFMLTRVGKDRVVVTEIILC